MRITLRQLRRLITETVGEMRSQEAISGAQTHMRTDGMSFQDFAGLIVDKLNLYDEWLSNESVEDVVAELTGDSQEMTPEDKELSALIDRQAREMAGDLSGPDWEPGPGYDASGIGDSA